MDPGSRPPSIHPFERATAPPSLAELRAQLEAAAQAYPALRRGLNGAIIELRRALGEEVPTRADRRGGLR